MTGTTFLALSLRAEGYSVFANVEASGTTTALIRDVSNSRMQAAGVQLVSLFAIVCDLMRDWRNTPGSVEVLPYLNQYCTYILLTSPLQAGQSRTLTLLPIAIRPCVRAACSGPWRGSAEWLAHPGRAVVAASRQHGAV